MRIVISEVIDDAAVATLTARFDVVYDRTLVDWRDALKAALAEADALIVRNRTQVDVDLLRAAPRLRAVGRLGAGLDNIDTEACRSRGIAVIPATGAGSLAVAEYVICAAMRLLRRAYRSTHDVAAGEWPRATLGGGRELHGKTLGLIGFGDNGRTTARLARALGMTVIGFDVHVPGDSPVWAQEGTTRRPFAEVIAEADVLSLHVPLTAATRDLIDAARIRTMKRDAIVINTARGGVVDEFAIATALREHRLGGAALDVFEREPLPADSPLRHCPNVLLTPHIAGVTREANARVSMQVAEEVAATLAAR